MWELRECGLFGNLRVDLKWLESDENLAFNRSTADLMDKRIKRGPIIL